MARNNARHIITGLKAIIPEIHVVDAHNVWIPAEHMPKAVEFLNEKTDCLNRPRVYAAVDGDIALRI